MTKPLRLPLWVTFGSATPRSKTTAWWSPPATTLILTPGLRCTTVGGTLLACSNDEGRAGKPVDAASLVSARPTSFEWVAPLAAAREKSTSLGVMFHLRSNHPLAVDTASGRGYAMFGLGGGSSWQDVLDVAEGLGGTPATLTTPEENNFVVTHMTPTQVGGPTAIGLVQEGDEEPLGGWRWLTDEPLDWTNWRAGEPNEPHWVKTSA